jgi:DNA-binding MarR family transcriptional regulator
MMERKDTPEAAKTVADLLLSLMRHLTAGVDDPVVELPLAQLRVCGVLRRGPLPMSAIGREVGASLSAMTQIADRLERAELVRRVAKGEDRRVRCLELTPRGEKLMRAHEETRVRRIADVLKHLNAEQQEQVMAALGTLIDAAAATRGGSQKAGTREPYFLKSEVLL